jgi:ketosteroid isomerase-like protein
MQHLLGRRYPAPPTLPFGSRPASVARLTRDVSSGGALGQIVLLNPTLQPRLRHNRRVGSTRTSGIARQVDLVKQLFDAFERRDVEAALALLDPEVKLATITAQVTREGRPYEGHAGVREYIDDALRVWDEIELVPSEFQSVLGAVVVIGEVRARGPAGEVRQPTVWTWRLRDDQIVEGSVHADLEAARQALGPDPPGI